jgi:hypothetical protein
MLRRSARSPGCCGDALRDSSRWVRLDGSRPAGRSPLDTRSLPNWRTTANRRRALSCRRFRARRRRGGMKCSRLRPYPFRRTQHLIRARHAQHAGGYDPRGLQRAVGSTGLVGLSHISRSARQQCEPCSRGLGPGQPRFIRSSPWLKPYALRRESDVDGLLYEIQSHCARGCDQHGGDTGENEAAHYDPAGYHRSLKLGTSACEIKHDRAAIMPQGRTSHRRVQSAGRTRPCNSRADPAAGGVKLGEHPRCVRLPA